MSFVQPGLFDAPNVGVVLKERAFERLGVREGEQWRDDLLRMFPRFAERLRSAGRTEFRIEEFREFALANGIREPETHHAWGIVPRWLKSSIQNTGQFEPATSARTHGHFVRVYRIRDSVRTPS